MPHSINALVIVGIKIRKKSHIGSGGAYIEGGVSERGEKIWEWGRCGSLGRLKREGK